MAQEVEGKPGKEMQQSAKGRTAQNQTGDSGTHQVCFPGLLDIFYGKRNFYASVVQSAEHWQP